MEKETDKIKHRIDHSMGAFWAALISASILAAFIAKSTSGAITYFVCYIVGTIVSAGYMSHYNQESGRNGLNSDEIIAVFLGTAVAMVGPAIVVVILTY